MDRRSLIALLLIFVVIVGGTMLRDVIWPAPPVPADSVAIDSTRRVASTTDTARHSTPSIAARDTFAAQRTVTAAAATPMSRPETTSVAASGRQMQFISPGAAPASVTLTDYRDLKRRAGAVSLRPEEGSLLGYRIINGADTIHLDRLTFAPTENQHGVEFVSTTPAVRVRYDADTANYLTHVSVSVAGAAANARLLVDLAPDLTSGEANEAEDVRSLAYGFRPSKNDVVSVHLPKLDSTYRVEDGPIEWVA